MKIPSFFKGKASPASQRVKAGERRANAANSLPWQTDGCRFPGSQFPVFQFSSSQFPPPLVSRSSSPTSHSPFAILHANSPPRTGNRQLSTDKPEIRKPATGNLSTVCPLRPAVAGLPSTPFLLRSTSRATQDKTEDKSSFLLRSPPLRPAVAGLPSLFLLRQGFLLRFAPPTPRLRRTNRATQDTSQGKPVNRKLENRKLGNWELGHRKPKKPFIFS